MVDEPRGLYRTRTPESGAEYVWVDHGTPTSLGEMPRAAYDERGYQPPFDQLPTKEQYEKNIA
jgi:hypothetical protein